MNFLFACDGQTGSRTVLLTCDCLPERSSQSQARNKLTPAPHNQQSYLVLFIGWGFWTPLSSSSRIMAASLTMVAWFSTHPTDWNNQEETDLPAMRQWTHWMADFIGRLCRHVGDIVFLHASNTLWFIVFVWQSCRGREEKGHLDSADHHIISVGKWQSRAKWSNFFQWYSK